MALDTPSVSLRATVCRATGESMGGIAQWQPQSWSAASFEGTVKLTISDQARGVRQALGRNIRAAATDHIAYAPP